MAFLLRQLRMRFISVQRNFSVFLGVKHESDNKSHPCLDQASGTAGRLQLHRPPPLPLLSSHALHPSCPLKARPAGSGYTCVVQQQRNRPKLLTALPLRLVRPPARPSLHLSRSLLLRLSQLHRRAVPYELLPAESLLLL